MSKLFRLVFYVVLLSLSSCQIPEQKPWSVFGITPTILQTEASSRLNLEAEWTVDDIYNVEWIAENKQLLATGKVGNRDPGIFIIDVNTHMIKWYQETRNAIKMSISPDANTLVVYGSGIEVWDLRSKKKIDNYKGNTNKEIQFLDNETLIIGESQIIRSGPYATEVSTLNIKSKERKVLFETEGWIRKLSMGKDKYIIVDVGKITGKVRDKIIVWDIHTRKEICEIPGYNGTIIPNSDAIIISDWTNGISVGELISCSTHVIINDLIDPYHLDVTSQGKRLAYGTNSPTKTIEIWNLESKKREYSIPGYFEHIKFSKDGKRLLLSKEVEGVTKLLIWTIKD